MNDEFVTPVRAAAAPDGWPLPTEERALLERCLGVDLVSIRVHSIDAVDIVARPLGAAQGTAIWVDTALSGASRRRVVAHECAHVVQFACGGTAGLGHRDRSVAAQCRTVLEAEADRVADVAVAGGRTDAYRGVAMPSAPVGGHHMLFHDAFEHHALGDLSTDDIVAITGTSAPRTQVLQQRVQLLALWMTAPLTVTVEQIDAICPWIRTVRLQASGLLVTYGELNALPDYIATGQTADEVSGDVLLPILQFIRQQTYNQCQKLLGNGGSTSFDSAVIGPGVPFFSLINKLLESKAVDELTHDLGYRNTDHYLAVLARNACHFAPFSWFRWKSFHESARSLVLQAYSTSDSSRKAAYVHDASSTRQPSGWRAHGRRPGDADRRVRTPASRPPPCRCRRDTSAGDRAR